MPDFALVGAFFAIQIDRIKIPQDPDPLVKQLLNQEIFGTVWGNAIAIVRPLLISGKIRKATFSRALM